jgi:hypothetical protein
MKRVVRPLLRRYRITYKVISQAFGFKNVNSFAHSTARVRYLDGIEEILTLVHNKIEDKKSG